MKHSNSLFTYNVHKLSTSCVRTACFQLLEQAVNNFDGVIRLVDNLIVYCLTLFVKNKRSEFF